MFETLAWDTAYRAEKRRRKSAPKPQLAEPSELKPAFFVKHLLAGEKLFSSGEPKECVYRVESGRIGIFWSPPFGPLKTIEEVTAKSVFGLGYLERHIHDAIALDESAVSFWPRSALALLTQHSPSTDQRQADAVEREFAHLRTTIVASTANRSLDRVAAFLSVASQVNASDGRDPEILDDSMRCQVVADYLKIDVDTLADALVELERQGVIAFHPPHGLRICDRAQLDRFTSET